MKKTVVVYQSKYGTTKKYAQWLAQALSCDLFERKAMNADKLQGYDTIIYGGGLYAGGVSGLDLITQAYDRLRNKNLILFTCGLADPADTDNTNRIKEGLGKVLTADMQQRIKVFHLRGGIDYAKLGIVHKAMMAMLHQMTLKKDESTLRAEDKQMLATYGKTVDFTDPTTIEPIVSYVQGL